MICGESGKKVPINSLSPEVQAISSNRIDQVSLYLSIYIYIIYIYIYIYIYIIDMDNTYCEGREGR